MRSACASSIALRIYSAPASASAIAEEPAFVSIDVVKKLNLCLKLRAPYLIWYVC
jgi:hypothetical protein